MQCVHQSLNGMWVASCSSFSFCASLRRGPSLTFQSAGSASLSISSLSGSSLLVASSPSVTPSNSQFLSFANTTPSSSLVHNFRVSFTVPSPNNNSWQPLRDSWDLLSHPAAIYIWYLCLLVPATRDCTQPISVSRPLQLCHVALL